MYNSANMELRVWNDLDDPYDHGDLVYNWERIDDHDHTDTLGLPIPEPGLQTNSVSNRTVQNDAIGTQELQNGAVTNPKLAANAVTTDKILDGTILGADIADAQIDVRHIALRVYEAILPLGSIVPWFRPTGATPIPNGWVVCTGQAVAEADHDWVGAGTVTLPDLQNKFILGSATAGTGVGPTTAPAEKAVGGLHTRDLSHTHPVPGHTHVSNAHTHVAPSHNHSIQDHAHGIIPDGAHNHGLRSRQTRTMSTAQPPTGYDNYLQTTYIGGFNSGGGDASVPGVPAHNHGGSTTGSGAFSTGFAQGTTAAQSDYGMSTVSQTTSNNTQNIGADLRPAFVGLLYIMKVKNPRA